MLPVAGVALVAGAVALTLALTSSSSSDTRIVDPREQSDSDPRPGVPGPPVAHEHTLDDRIEQAMRASRDAGTSTGSAGSAGESGAITPAQAQLVLLRRAIEGRDFDTAERYLAELARSDDAAARDEAMRLRDTARTDALAHEHSEIAKLVRRGACAAARARAHVAIAAWGADPVLDRAERAEGATSCGTAVRTRSARHQGRASDTDASGADATAARRIVEAFGAKDFAKVFRNCQKRRAARRPQTVLCMRAACNLGKYVVAREWASDAPSIRLQVDGLNYCGYDHMEAARKELLRRRGQTP